MANTIPRHSNQDDIGRLLIWIFGLLLGVLLLEHFRFYYGPFRIGYVWPFFDGTATQSLVLWSTLKPKTL